MSSEVEFNADIACKATDIDVFNIIGFYFMESIHQLAK
jgi:hypothetical protein